MVTLIVNGITIGTAPSFNFAADSRLNVDRIKADGFAAEIAINTQVIADARALTYAEQELTRAGRLISAIKSVRSRLGLGLKDAKDLVDAYKASPEFSPAPGYCLQRHCNGRCSKREAF
jgi:ribosomal protein L7/L12